jgi:TPR repeat protein
MIRTAQNIGEPALSRSKQSIPAQSNVPHVPRALTCPNDVQDFLEVMSMPKYVSAAFCLVFLNGFVVAAVAALPSYDPEILSIQEQALGGDPVFQHRLGLMYVQGDVIHQDYPSALYWFKKAAAQGHTASQYNLGTMFALGLGTKQDYARSAFWFELAAEKGHAPSQNNLAMFLRYGMGVDKDVQQALSWYRRSAAQGNPDGQYHLARAYLDGEIVAPDPAHAMRLFTLSAEKGHAPAQFMLGYILATGQGGADKNLRRAAAWYKAAAEQGLPDAQLNLGLMYLTGQGVDQNMALAHMWLAIAKEFGHHRAASALSLAEQGMSPFQIEQAERLTKQWFTAFEALRR